MGKEQKKGVKGIAAAYITRNQAIKKLQITLKDFRRLCIVKGIYPRDPKKKKSGKDKTYYHVKDIRFLSHEPLLHKFRELKAFLKKRKKAQIKKDAGRIAKLEKHKPKFTLDHLVRERYPSFVDALRDLDDALCMVYLFGSLPSSLTKDHKPELAAMCTRLIREFESYVFKTKSLRKVFVSIKGMYYQAIVQGQTVTWLQPHKFNQFIPQDVDVRVMLTFLDFYLTMTRFTAFKLYHDVGLQYPPKVDAVAAAKRAGLAAIQLEKIEENGSSTSTSTSTSAPKKATSEQLQLQSVVQDVLSKLGEAEEEAGEGADAAMEQAEAEAEAEKALDDFTHLDPTTLSPEELEARQYRELFHGLTFVIGRECPSDSLEFVILCGSGRVLREDQLSKEEFESGTIQYQVMDRPTLKNKIEKRIYVQPQWIYDSFNTTSLLPTEPYGPGATPPPHLSPFINDEAEGYVPAQRKVLEQWGALAKGESTAPKTAGAEEDGDEDDEEEEETALEAAYASDMARERKGVLFSQAQEEDEEEGDEEDDEEEEDEEEDSSEEDEEEEEEEEEVVAPQTKGKKRGRKTKQEEEEELRKIMMNKKDSRIYSRMQHGIQKKADAVALLESKRRKIEKKSEPVPAKPAKSAKKSAKASNKGGKKKSTKK